MMEVAEVQYTCTRCKQQSPKRLMLAKKVTFMEIGRGGRQSRSRITDHLCPACVAADPDWNQPRWSGSPGLRDANVTVL